MEDVDGEQNEWKTLQSQVLGVEILIINSLISSTLDNVEIVDWNENDILCCQQIQDSKLKL